MVSFWIKNIEIWSEYDADFVLQLRTVDMSSSSWTDITNNDAILIEKKLLVAGHRHLYRTLQTYKQYINKLMICEHKDDCYKQNMKWKINN